ncbi:MAG: ATP-binding sensor histidine kinase [Marinoscillum sp.]
MDLLDRALKIAEGFNSSIYQLSDDTYGQEVILKVMKEDFNYHPHSSQLYNEDKYLREVNTKGIRSSLDLIEDHQTPILVLEYFDGESLKNWRKHNNPTIMDCLKIAIHICESLAEVHSKHNLIHRDISAHNILVNHKLETSLIDFGLAINVDIKLSIKGISDQLLGTLPYISPEQTGRVNHAVDYRSDLYSFGVVLYELFTGQLPFESNDPLELIHSHLAIAPEPPYQVNSQIPNIFSDIILKLMSKDMEHRYQSAKGLLEDLKKCHDQAALKVEINHFALGQNDQSGRFLIPSKIYGRETETKRLLKSIDTLGSGRKEIALVAGKSGTGKTSLIYEIHKPITQKRGYFIKGKHQQFQKDRPYQAITQAISSFITLLLSENETSLKRWKEIIQNALGDQGKLLTDLIPNLELIIGKQEKLPVLGINEAQNRFSYLFTQFIKALATKEHPLVMFIDDLQWSDNASLKLLRSLITEPNLDNFFFIGAYRDNEIHPSHPLEIIFKGLDKEGVHIENIKLNDLSFEDTVQMVNDTFSSTIEKARELTSVIHAKTAGNPFFVNQFLKSIYEQELVWYHHPDNASKGCWEWDSKGLETTNFTDNVVEFMVDKLRKMKPGVQRQLTLGACIGDRFDLVTLEQIQGPQPEDLLEDLWQSVVEQLLVVEESQGDAGLVRHLKLNSANTLVYRFAHDRIRQAAYELIPEEEKAQVHQRVGELLLTNTNIDNQKERVFDIVNQLNLGVPKKDQAYRLQLAHLNHIAGSKAAASTANESAVIYYDAALDLIEEEDWNNQHNLLFTISLDAMESHFVVGNYSRMETLGNALIAKAKTKLESLQTYNIFVQSYIAQSKHIELIDYGLSILKKAGIRLPSNPSDFDILLSLIRTKLKLRGKKAAFFESLPSMEDEHMALAINMMSSISTASYHNYPKLFPLVIFKSVQLSLKYGNSVDSIPFYGGYGTILCGVLGEYDTGYEFGKISMDMIQTSPEYKSIIPKTMVIYNGFIHHWKDPLKDALKPYDEAYLVSLEIGDNQYAASAAFLKCCTGFLSGSRLSDLIPDAQSYLDKMPSFNQESYFQYMKIVLQGIYNLNNALEKPWLLEGEIFSVESFFSTDYKEELQTDGTAIFHIAFYKLYLNYLFGNDEIALEGSDATIKQLEVITSTAYVPVVNFYDSLVRLKLCINSSPARKRKLLAKVKSNQKKMKIWANHAPSNYLHKYELVEAELRSVTNSSKPIKDLYNNSIQHAEDAGYLNELALAYECAGRHFERNDDEPLQIHYLTNALKAYKKWGVVAKVKDLKQEFPFLGERTERRNQSTFTEGSFSYGSLSGNNLLDLASVLKAASTISSEIQLGKAIPTLLKIITENAGAQSGAFILVNNDKLELQAISSVEVEAQMVTPLDVAETDYVPVSVIQYVGRTKDTVILDEPEKDERFQRDDYLLANDIASLLCMPVIHQQSLLGIIYLENRLTKGSFTAERTDLLSLLSGQIAVTLHNALLYDLLEQKVIERTKEIEKQKEKLNRQNLQLTNLNEEKDFLISVVSHDLRNPLQLIKGYTNLVLKEENNEQTQEFLGYVIESSDRMEGFITRILNVSAINSGDIKLNPSEVEMVSLLKSEVEDFIGQSAKKDINLSFTSSADSINTTIDKGYFNQIISNLISNAIKYTQKGGSVEVSVEMLESGDYYRILVKDNGQGIPKRAQKLLFSKFQTLGSKPTDGEESTGLGLAIVKKYVDAMDGHIWCESEYEKGSSFFVEFPFEKELKLSQKD